MAQVRTISVYTTSRLDQGFVLLKRLLVSHLKSVFTVATLPCAALKIIWLPETVKYVCLKGRSSRSRGTLDPQKIIFFREMYLVIEKKWKDMMKTTYYQN